MFNKSIGHDAEQTGGKYRQQNKYYATEIAQLTSLITN